jgi:hypothetical protein
LQLRGLARPLSPEEQNGRVGGHNRALVRAEKVAGVLGRKDQRALVLANPAGEADHEAADRRVFEEEAELIDYEHPAPVPAFDPRP